MADTANTGDIKSELFTILDTVLFLFTWLVSFVLGVGCVTPLAFLLSHLNTIWDGRWSELLQKPKDATLTGYVWFLLCVMPYVLATVFVAASFGAAAWKTMALATFSVYCFDATGAFVVTAIVMIGRLIVTLVELLSKKGVKSVPIQTDTVQSVQPESIELMKDVGQAEDVDLEAGTKTSQS